VEALVTVIGSAGGALASVFIIWRILISRVNHIDDRVEGLQKTVISKELCQTKHDSIDYRLDDLKKDQSLILMKLDKQGKVIAEIVGELKRINGRGG